MKGEFGDFLKYAELNNGMVELDLEKIKGFEGIKKEIVENSDEILMQMEEFIEKEKNIGFVRIRLKNLPNSTEISIKNIRAENLHGLITIEGIIKKSFEPELRVINAKFKCSNCGAIISVSQIDKKFREPTGCKCKGNKKFLLISKEFVDAQRLIIQESPEFVSEGERSRILNIFLKEDLVSPELSEKLIQGAKIKVIGILKEVPIALSSGGLSTRFEKVLEANNLFFIESKTPGE